MTTAKPRILYCHCAYAQVVPAEVKTAVLRTLCDSGASFESVADLCEMAARKDPALHRLADGAPLKIAACYPRAVKWLFASARAPLKHDQTEILNMRVLPAEAVAAAVLNADLNANVPTDTSRQETSRASTPENISTPTSVSSAS